MEFYQWLLRRNGLEVSDTGYFVYCNGRRDRESFEGRLDFDIKVIPYTGSDTWVEGTIQDIFETLEKPKPPSLSPDCEYCRYVKEAAEML